MMRYKGFIGQVEFDDEANVFHGEVINTRDVITFQGRSTDELQREFRESIDIYLDWCKERGKEPEKPFSGKFPVRTTPELHAKAYAAARRAGKSLNAWVTELLKDAAA